MTRFLKPLIGREQWWFWLSIKGATPYSVHEVAAQIIRWPLISSMRPIFPALSLFDFGELINMETIKCSAG